LKGGATRCATGTTAPASQTTRLAGARKAETAFFSITEPWSTSSESARFGTDDLVATLSTLLVNIISEKWVDFILNNAAFGDVKIAIRWTTPWFVAQLRTDPNAAECTALRAEDEDYDVSVSSNDITADKRIYLDDIREIVDKCVCPINILFGLTFVFRARTRELPGDIPASAKTTLVAFQ
jgi:hypothetical protein